MSKTKKKKRAPKIKEEVKEAKGPIYKAKGFFSQAPNKKQNAKEAEQESANKGFDPSKFRVQHRG